MQWTLRLFNMSYLVPSDCCTTLYTVEYLNKVNTQRAGWCSGNPTDLYSSARLVSRGDGYLNVVILFSPSKQSTAHDCFLPNPFQMINTHFPTHRCATSYESCLYKHKHNKFHLSPRIKFQPWPAYIAQNCAHCFEQTPSTRSSRAARCPRRHVKWGNVFWLFPWHSRDKTSEQFWIIWAIYLLTHILHYMFYKNKLKTATP